MTNQRFLTPVMTDQFEPNEEQWTHIAEVAGLSAFTTSEQITVKRIAEHYLSEAAAHWSGIPPKAIEQHHASMLKSVRNLRAGLWNRRLFDQPEPSNPTVVAAYAVQVMTAFLDDPNKSPREMNDIEEYLDEIDALLTKTGKLIEKCVHVAPTPAKSFERFAQRLQTFYEQKSELPPSARKDFGDYDRASPFVKFIHAIWMALPNFNGKSRSLSQMTRRLAGVLMAPE